MGVGIVVVVVYLYVVQVAAVAAPLAAVVVGRLVTPDIFCWYRTGCVNLN